MIFDFRISCVKPLRGHAPRIFEWGKLLFPAALLCAFCATATAEQSGLLNSFSFPTATATATATSTATSTATATASPTATSTPTASPTATATATATATPTATAGTYLINQNFEGTNFHGYDNGETWVYSAAGVDPDYTTAPAPLRAAQSLRLFANDSFTYTTYTPQNDLWAFCEFQIVTLPGQQSTTGLILGTNAGWIGLNLNQIGTIQFGYPPSLSSASAMHLAAGVHYYLWMHCIVGGTNTLYISSTTTRPAADDSTHCKISIGDANSTGFHDVGVWHESTLSTAAQVIYDHVLVSPSSIGDNP